MSATPVPSPSLLDASRIELLDPVTLRFSWHDNHLRLTIAERASWMRVSVLRCFPLARPASHWSVRDPANKEVGLISDPSRLDADSRAAVAEEIERRYLVVAIRRIISAQDRYGIVEWVVETARGRTTFSTRNVRDSALRPAPGRWLLTDVEGRRFEIPNTSALDASSCAILQLHL